jgi:hypothetical protein
MPWLPRIAQQLAIIRTLPGQDEVTLSTRVRRRVAQLKRTDAGLTLTGMIRGQTREDLLLRRMLRTRWLLEPLVEQGNGTLLLVARPGPVRAQLLSIVGVLLSHIVGSNVAIHVLDRAGSNYAVFQQRSAASGALR